MENLYFLENLHAMQAACFAKLVSICAAIHESRRPPYPAVASTRITSEQPAHKAQVKHFVQSILQGKSHLSLILS